MVALLSIFSCMFTSCKESEEGGQPVITGVRVCDPEKADSLFTKSAQGQTIAIIGQNLNNIVKITINGQNVGFSSTMNTDHSVIITVPTEKNGFELTAFNSNLKDEIIIETTHGTASYAFKVLGAYPQITRIQGEYPRKMGDILKVYGLNLYSIEDIYFSDVTAAALDSTKRENDEIPGNHVKIPEYKVLVEDRHLNSNQDYEVTSELAVVTPDLPFDEGVFVIQCAAGTVYMPYTKVPGKPVIKSISSDMPVIGETLVIKGNEFVQVESVTLGDVVYKADEFTVAESEDAISIDITKIPSAVAKPELIVKTAGGEVVFENFYNRSTLLFDFDGTGVDNGWDPNVTYDAPAVGASGNAGRFTAEREGTQWWGTMVFFRSEGDGFELPDYSVIPENTPAKELYLAMEVYNNNSEYDNGVFGGYLRMTIWPIGGDTAEPDPYVVDNFEWTDYNAGEFAHPLGNVLEDANGKNPQQQWYRHVFCLNNFPHMAGLTYKDIKEMGISNVRIQAINQTVGAGSYDFYVDNIRIIKKSW